MLTDPLNLPAPGRHHTLYVLFTSLQSAVFLVNSRYPQVTATSVSSRSKSSHRPRCTFFRSYGANLPSSLTRVLSSALGYSPHLPVSVCGTVTNVTPYEDFLGSMGSPTLRAKGSRHYPSALAEERICLLFPPTGMNRDFQHPDRLPFSVPPSVKRHVSGTGTIDPFPITYAFRPQLRGRLTLSRLTLLRKP